MNQKKFIFINTSTGDVVELSVSESLDMLNNDLNNSHEWEDYDETDWVEGMLEFSPYKIKFLKGQQFKVHRTGEISTLLNDTIVTHMNFPMYCKEGNYTLHELIPLI